MQGWELLSDSLSEYEIVDLAQKWELYCLSQREGRTVPAGVVCSTSPRRLQARAESLAHGILAQRGCSWYSCFSRQKGSLGSGMQKFHLLLSLSLHCSHSPSLSSLPFPCLCFLVR